MAIQNRRAVRDRSAAWGKVYGGSEDKFLYCLRGHGSSLWKFEAADPIYSHRFRMASDLLRMRERRILLGGCCRRLPELEEHDALYNIEVKPFLAAAGSIMAPGAPMSCLNTATASWHGNAWAKALPT